MNLLLLGLWVSPAAWATTYEVCPSGPSCTHATLADALGQAIDGDVLLVHPGTWSESLAITAAVSLVSVSGADDTILSGSGAATVVVDCPGGTVDLDGFTLDHSASGAALQVVAGTVAARNIRIDGLTGVAGPVVDVTGGATLNAERWLVTGVQTQTEAPLTARAQASLTLQDAVFSMNSGDTGGAVLCADCTLQLADATFDGNLAATGGAIALSTTSEVVVQDTLFSGNDAGDGGALYGQAGQLSVIGGLFCANTADEGAAALVGGASLWHNNLFVDNSAGVGAVLVATGSPLVENNAFVSNVATGSAVNLSTSTNAGFVNNLLASNRTGQGAFQSDAVPASWLTNAWHDNRPDHVAGSIGVSDLQGMLVDIDPMLSEATCDWDGARPYYGSPLVDSGTGLDPDGSVADVGSHGGPDAPADLWTDGDADGFIELFDCDDSDPLVRPDAKELCNGVDDDCDGEIDDSDATLVAPLWYEDNDGDGFGESGAGVGGCARPSGYVNNDADCDDGDPTLNPGTVWYLDADGDGYGGGTSAQACVPPSSAWVREGGDCNDQDGAVNPGTEWFADADADGFGAGDPVVGCAAPGNDWTLLAGDCNDASTAQAPGQAEACNALDDDCNGQIDDGLSTTTWYPDVDEDGYGDGTNAIAACLAPTGTVAVGGDCDDLDPKRNPSAVETCNEVDDDCDGVKDDGVIDTWYRDADEDAHGDVADTKTACTRPTGYVAVGDDCNDDDADVHPGAAEYCDTVDDDCDGLVDEDAVDATRFWSDEDGDGYGGGRAKNGCPSSEGAALNGDDCDDEAADVYPGAPERCDGKDDDCNGEIDDDVADPPTWYRDQDGDGYGGSVTVEACQGPPDYVLVGGDCDDRHASANPEGVEVTNDNIDQDCNGELARTFFQGGGGCACASDGAGAGPWWLLLLAGLRRRRLITGRG